MNTNFQEKKNVVASLLKTSAAITLCVFLAACGDDSSNNANTSDSQVVVGSMNDLRDGKTYKTVKINLQTWMAENLNYETVGSDCAYDDLSDCSKYGRFYTWNAAQKACPYGYHLPTEEDWDYLFMAVGGEAIAGKMLKSKSGWAENGNGTDSYGFSALPTGLIYMSLAEFEGVIDRGDMTIDDIIEKDYYAHFWGENVVMSLIYNTDSAYVGGYSNNGPLQAINENHHKYPIRCIQD